MSGRRWMEKNSRFMIKFKGIFDINLYLHIFNLLFRMTLDVFGKSIFDVEFKVIYYCE
jgi:hypothetical protein